MIGEYEPEFVGEDFCNTDHDDCCDTVDATTCYPFTYSHTSPGFYLSPVQVYLKHCRKRRNCS